MAHIRKLPKGRFEARYRAPDGNERSRRFTTKRDAQAHLDQIGVDRRAGTWRDPRAGRVPFADWATEWEATTVHLRASSRARDASYLRNHVLPRFGTMRLDAIDVLEVKRWVADLSAAGLAPATVHKIYQVLSKALRGAVDAGLIAQSPCRRIDLPRIERDEMRFLTPIEIAQLADAIDPRYRAMILVASYCGLRLGELAGLCRGQVDLDARTIRVIENAVEVEGEIVRGAPKTKAGRRTVPIPRDDRPRPGAPSRHLHRAGQGRPGLPERRRRHPAIRELAVTVLDARHPGYRPGTTARPRPATHRRGPLDRRRRQPQADRRLGRPHVGLGRPRSLRAPSRGARVGCPVTPRCVRRVRLRAAP